MAILSFLKPEYWNTLFAQNNATAGNAAVNSTGTSAAKVAESGNGLQGANNLTDRLFSPNTTDLLIKYAPSVQKRVNNLSADDLNEVNKTEQDFAKVANSGKTYNDFNWDFMSNIDPYTKLAESWGTALKDLEEEREWKQMWEQARAHSPSYILGR